MKCQYAITIVTFAFMVILGRHINLFYYPTTQDWAGDWIPVINGYYASLGDFMQWLGFSLCFVYCFWYLYLRHAQTTPSLYNHSTLVSVPHKQAQPPPPSARTVQPPQATPTTGLE